ncbi:putative reverse transcriptase domain-containing protein [Tanacetum coccineum]
MDWLAYHRALIDCYEKIVRIPLSNGEILEVQGERPEKDLRSLACIKADEKKLDDIRVVRDFPEVFPDYLLGLPLVREIEFRIDLILGASPIVRSPYRSVRRHEGPPEVDFLDLLEKEKFKVESVKNWKTPESSTEIRSFLGLAGYYRRFIENFSKIAKPLTLLTQKNKAYVWGDKQDEAFQILKEKLCNALVLALPDGPDDFVVYCDASKQDALSRKERLKPRQVRAMSITIHSGLKTKILDAQSEASKGSQSPTEWLKRIRKTTLSNEDDLLKFTSLIEYGFHQLTIAEYVSRCLTCSKIKAEHQKPSGFLQQPEILGVEMGKVNNGLYHKFLKASSRYDSIWVIWIGLTSRLTFLPIREGLQNKKLQKIMVNEIVARHGVPVSIISDRDGRFTSHLWQAFQEALGLRGLDMSTAYHPQTSVRLPHGSINVWPPFEALYGRKCRSPVIWTEVGESQLIGPEIVQETTEKIVQIKERLKTARSRQKSYADKRRKPLEFQVGDRVLLKVSPWKGVVRFGKKGKLAPRYVGPLEIVENAWLRALRRPSPARRHSSRDEIEIDENLRFVEEPIEIVERDVKKLKRRRIPLVKVRWNSRQGAEYTWEHEDQFRMKYPHLFSEPVLSQVRQLEP